MKIRQAKIEDIPEILKVEEEAWGKEKAATKEMFESRIKIFPEGTVVAELNKKIVGVVVAERINYDSKMGPFTWYEITDNGFIKNSHKKNGNTIYGVDLSVVPSFRDVGVGKKLLESIARLAIRYNIIQGMLGGRIPGYYKYADKMDVEKYLNTTIKTENGREYLDPQVDFYKKSGLEIVKILPNYFEDPESLNYGVLLIWRNPFYGKWYRWFITKIFKV